jgi:exodeoxyribonuclease VII large subunit
VADLRAATPSAAAELVIRSKQELADKLLALRSRMAQTINYRLLRAHNALSQLAQHAVFARMQDSIARRQQKVDDLVVRLAQAQSRLIKKLERQVDRYEAQLRHHDLRVRAGEMRRRLASDGAELSSAISLLLLGRRTQLDRLTVALGRASETVLLRQRSYWERLHSNLLALSPKAILARGYALVFDADGHLVKRASQLASGDAVRTQLGEGEFTARVDQVKEVDSG